MTKYINIPYPKSLESTAYVSKIYLQYYNTSEQHTIFEDLGYLLLLAVLPNRYTILLTV